MEQDCNPFHNKALCHYINIPSASRQIVNEAWHFAHLPCDNAM